jgi:phosphoglycerate dehydrogenase-like enzyme
MAGVKVAAILDTQSEAARFFLSSAPPNFDVILVDPKASDDEKIRLCRDALAIVASHSGQGVSPELLRRCDKLRLLQLLSAGYNRLDMTAIRETAIPVANNGGANAVAVAEHTLALMLAVYRHLPQLWTSVRQRRWQQGVPRSQFREITGKTVGIVGLGRIGREVAKRLSGFGCSLLCYEPNDVAPDVARELRITPVALDRLLQESDIVTLHVPLMPSTQRLIGRRELALMKTDAVLINTCRGPVVDEAALCDALREGRIAGAGLDVLDQEPADAGNPLLEMDNVVVTPHSGAASREGAVRAADFAFANIQRVSRGEPAQSVVSAEA